MHRILASACLVLLAACGDPPDETPLGRECAALLARPEQPVEAVKLQHVLIAFVGAKQGSDNDDGTGTYRLTQADRGTYAADFAAVAFRLAPGEVGLAAWHRSRSPFGWHVIKRLE
jgi:hypothetical protein